jgi:uncharacterized protein YndB with AHSA1/START domain
MKWVVRILGALVCLVVLAVAVLAGLGMKQGSDELRTSIEIARPPSAVWPWITQPEKQTKWVSWLVEIRPVGDKREGVGTKSVWVMEDKNNGGRLMEIVGEVTAAEKDKFVAVDLASAGAFDGKGSYTLTDLGGGRTRMETFGKYHFQNAFARLMTPLIMPQAAKKMNTDLATLKTMVEAEPAQVPVVEQTSATAK